MSLETTRIAGVECTRLGLGCWVFGGSQWGGQDDDESAGAVAAALEAGITHFDTAMGYGGGKSESVLGQALAGLDGGLSVASKCGFQETAEAMVAQVDASLARLGRDVIDLYYIHWPKTGADLRPCMEGLEQCRAAGKIRGIGVSNFSCEQMDEVRQAGCLDAHQFCYNLFWRFPERDIIPYCLEHRIAGVTYSSIAQGILTGKFPEHPTFAPGDQRPQTVLFDLAVFPHLWAAAERMKPLAEQAGRSLVELAIRWCSAHSTAAWPRRCWRGCRRSATRPSRRCRTRATSSATTRRRAPVLQYRFRYPPPAAQRGEEPGWWTSS
ncbi:MAG: aldo/keto reductase [Armatimonadetes bacterium]|nr:aldo/keto reductase [Armatimonadota bacterium]